MGAGGIIMKMSTKKLTRLALLAAISIVLLLAVRIPFPPAPFLEYDPADIPIFIGTFAFGPLAGFLLTIVVAVLQGMTVSAGSNIIGIMMHIFATGGYVLVAGNIYKRKKNKKNAVVALCSGTVAWVLLMVIFNLIFTPIFMGTSIDEVLGMLLPIIIPFNLLKAGINSILTYILYKSTGKLLHVE